eukprot:scaffold45954_cov62-Phaeocystis_antarctica.AAC.7
MLDMVEDITLDPRARQYGKRGRDALALSQPMSRWGVHGSESVHGSDSDADDRRMIAPSCVVLLSTTTTSTALASTGASGPLSPFEILVTIDATDTLMCARFQRGCTCSSPPVPREPLLGLESTTLS